MPKEQPVHIAAPPRVLVVDDERRLRDVLRDVIQDMDLDVTTASTAEEALATMHAEPHDVILLDLHLPGMSGMELFERVQENWPETQVIVLTAFGNLDSARQAIRLNVVDFLCKPFHLRDVELSLDRARRRMLATTTPIAPELPAVQAPPSASPQTLAELEKQQILEALDRNGGNRTRAARELGISRRALHYRLKEYGVTGR
jgi:DNA-binding NtrC family response regulator